MTLLSVIGAGGWALLAGWVLPSGIVATVFVLLVFQDAELPVAEDIVGLSAGNQAIVLSLGAIGLGLLLNAAQVPLYRVLEGYLGWPRFVRERRMRHHLDVKHRMQRTHSAKHGLEQGLAMERLRHYPTDDDQVAPTALGNAIRAFETYAYDRYRLDSQTLWSELVVQVPESLRTEIDRARASVDFCVAVVYLSVGFGGVSLIAGLTQIEERTTLLVSGGVAVALALPWYRLAVKSTGHWHSTVQALVNLGRLPLAQSLGVEIPKELKGERDMWQQVTWFVREPFDEQLTPEGIDPFRIEPARGECATWKKGTDEQ